MNKVVAQAEGTNVDNIAASRIHNKGTVVLLSGGSRAAHLNHTERLNHDRRVDEGISDDITKLAGGTGERGRLQTLKPGINV